MANSKEFKAFMDPLKIKFLPTSTASPWSNGAAERAVQSIKKAIRHFIIQEKCPEEWDQYIFYYVNAHNKSISVYGYAPEELHFGQSNPAITDLIEFWPQASSHEDYIEKIIPFAQEQRKNAREKIAQKTKQTLTYRNQKRKSKKFQPGQIVIHRQLQVSTGQGGALKPLFTGPYVIESIDRDKSSALILHLQNNHQMQAHFTNIQLLQFDPATARLPQNFDEIMENFLPEKDTATKYFPDWNMDKTPVLDSDGFRPRRNKPNRQDNSDKRTRSPYTENNSDRRTRSSDTKDNSGRRHRSPYTEHNSLEKNKSPNKDKNSESEIEHESTVAADGFIEITKRKNDIIIERHLLLNFEFENYDDVCFDDINYYADDGSDPLKIPIRNHLIDNAVFGPKPDLNNPNNSPIKICRRSQRRINENRNPNYVKVNGTLKRNGKIYKIEALIEKKNFDLEKLVNDRINVEENKSNEQISSQIDYSNLDGKLTEDETYDIQLNNDNDSFTANTDEEMNDLNPVDTDVLMEDLGESIPEGQILSDELKDEFYTEIEPEVTAQKKVIKPTKKKLKKKSPTANKFQKANYRENNEFKKKSPLLVPQILKNAHKNSIKFLRQRDKN